MKQLKELIKRTNLNSEHLSEKELSLALGGDDCHCGCFYCSCGGSSSTDNSNTNKGEGFVSPLPDISVVSGICT